MDFEDGSEPEPDQPNPVGGAPDWSGSSKKGREDIRE